MNRVIKIFWVLLLLTIVFSNAFSDTAVKHTPLYSFCRRHKINIKFNMDMDYITLKRRRHLIRVHLLMPYIVHKNKIYYMQSRLQMSAKGEILLPYEYVETISELLRIKRSKAQPVETEKPNTSKMKSTNSYTEQFVSLIPDAKPTNTTKNPTAKLTNKSTKKANVTPSKDEKYPQKVYNNTGFQKINAIIIDAGHGGKDPGAMSKSGLKEKKIVLAIAKYLRDYLKKDGKYPVLLTRRGDYFVTLEKRTKLSADWAKRYNSIFVSIHANANPFGNWAEGVEVFSLSDKASDDTAMNAARMENAGFSAKDVKKTEGLYAILLDLVKDALMMQSEKFSKVVSKSIVKYTGAKSRGTKKAPFYVLKFNTVPSILVEVGFLTHKAEAKKLKTTAYQKKIAKGIYYGINSYIKKYNNTRGYSK